MKNKSWVLVANSSQARLFSLETVSQLKELKDFVHPQSRLHEQDLVGDRPGRTNDSTGFRRHANEARTSQKDQEVEDFAKSIAGYLEKAAQNASFNRLYIAAGPEFLGILRKSLPQAITPLVYKEISKDLVQRNTAEILGEIVT